MSEKVSGQDPAGATAPQAVEDLLKNDWRQMRRDWDERAERDARFYIASGTADASSFWRSGEEELSALILSDVDLARSAEALEIGCGIGRLLLPLAQRIANVIGVDISPRMIEEARRVCKGMGNVRLAVTDGTLRGVEDRSLDFVFSYVVFQHIPEPEAIESYVREAARVLRPGGIFHFQVDGRIRRRDLYVPNTYAGANLTGGEVRAMVQAAGLSIVRQWGDGTHYLWTTSQLPGNLAAVRVVPRLLDPIEIHGFTERLAQACDAPIQISELESIRTAIEPFVTRYCICGADRFVKETFRVLLAREPLPQELEYNRGIVERGLEKPEDWIDTIVASSELRARLTPTIPRLSEAAKRRLRHRIQPDGEATLGALMLAIAERLRGLSDSDAVRRTFELILAREPSPEEHAYFTEKLELGHFTRIKVISQLLISDEQHTGVMPTPKALL